MKSYKIVKQQPKLYVAKYSYDYVESVTAMLINF
jgi:hypothetical protein